EPGSVELFFAQSLANIVNSHSYITLCLVWTLFRFEKLSVSLKNLAEAYQALQLGLSTRDERLQKSSLQEGEMQIIVDFLQQLLAINPKTLRRAHRFANTGILDLTLKLRARDASNRSETD